MMELAFNLEWMVLAIVMCWLRVRHGRHQDGRRLTQFVSLGLVLFMMFVVITMYDDMAMAQNPAETRCFQREDEPGAHMHAQLHPVVASTAMLAAEVPFNMHYTALPGSHLAPAAKAPVLALIQNRPPPAV